MNLLALADSLSLKLSLERQTIFYSARSEDCYISSTPISLMSRGQN